MKIICAWCLVLISETPEPGRDSHGICDKCATETFSDLTRDALSEMESPKTLADIEAGDLAAPDDDDDDRPSRSELEDYARVMQVEFDAGNL